MPNLSQPLRGRGRAARELKANLGDYIKSLRLSRGITQAELTQAIGLEWPNIISSIERGVSVVPPERYLQFARALGVDPKTFMKTVLMYTNPWAYALLFSEDPEKSFAAINDETPQRVGRKARRGGGRD